MQAENTQLDISPKSTIKCMVIHLMSNRQISFQWLYLTHPDGNVVSDNWQHVQIRFGNINLHEKCNDGLHHVPEGK